ncbi:MAG: tetratricopeptide repeat protein, partial [Myxococcota bacterium]
PGRRVVQPIIQVHPERAFQPLRIGEGAQDRGFGDWVDEAAILSALTDSERLEGTFRMYLDDGLNDAPSWLMGDLIDVLGTGASAAAVERARRAEDFPGMEPYYDAIEAEIALRRWRPAEAIALAEGALAAVPSAEVLLQARLYAVLAKAYQQQGRDRNALEAMQRVMQLDPGTIRRMSMALPARVIVTASGSEAKRVARMLGRSPRLSRDSGGFEVLVEGAAGALRVCLRSPLGDALSCADAPRPEPEGDDAPMGTMAYAQFVAQRFHDRAFATPLGVSAVDLNSLDGTTTVRAEEERARLEQLLREVD